MKAIVIAAVGLMALLGGCRTPAPSWRFDTARERALDAVLESAVMADDVPGVTVLVTTKDRILYHRAFGVLDPVAGRPLGPDAVQHRLDDEADHLGGGVDARG